MSDHLQTASGSPKHVRFNATVNIFDGAFFGFALGFASFTTIIPLFVSQLTDSAILIGLAPAIHTIGWQLPQLFTATRIRRLSRYKPMVLAMTIHERLPFLGLTLVAFFLLRMEQTTALVLVFVLLIWQGIGGGFTANVWQSLVAKIIPVSWRGSFFGTQMGAVNLLMSGAAVGAGMILERFDSPLSFTLCFALASVGMAISFFFIALTREEEHPPMVASGTQAYLWDDVKRILTKDLVFQRFLAIRVIFQLGMVAFSYYSVYAFNELGASAIQVGWLTGVFIFGAVILNLLFGALGDRKGHWMVLFLGTLAGLFSVILAGFVTTIPVWFVIFVLAGIANVVAFTTTMVISLGFGNPSDQATYIGLSNTLLAPATLISPFLAGWCIQTYGYMIMFRAAIVIFLVAALLSLSLFRQRATVRL